MLGRTTYSDVLWASPDCTNHSVAKGRKRATNQPGLFGDTIAEEAAEKSRATIWDVPRFAEEHGYKLIRTENVIDAAKWIMFDAWLLAMTSLGYNHHIAYMNSMPAKLGGLPAAQSRDSMYVIGCVLCQPGRSHQKTRPGNTPTARSGRATGDCQGRNARSLGSLRRKRRWAARICVALVCCQ